MPPFIATARVTAGLRCAPLTGPATTTPQNTASPHAIVMTIQPEFWPFDLASNTPATTPSPRRISVPVPRTSARNFSTMFPLLLNRPAATCRQALRVLTGADRDDKKSPRLGTTAEAGLVESLSRGRAKPLYSGCQPVSRKLAKPCLLGCGYGVPVRRSRRLPPAPRRASPPGPAEQ